jgi:hypothetical protein
MRGNLWKELEKPSYHFAQNASTFTGMQRKKEPVMPSQKVFPGRLSAMNMTTGNLSKEIRGLDSSGLGSERYCTLFLLNGRRI